MTTRRPQLQVGGLGPGWEHAERALATVQADLSRTVGDAPTLMLLWYDDVDRGLRHAFVGKAVDWYYGAQDGFELSRDYPGAVFDIAAEVQAAVADNLLGYLWAWPLCPDDGRLLSVQLDDHDDCEWVCDYGGGHVVGPVGGLLHRPQKPPFEAALTVTVYGPKGNEENEDDEQTQDANPERRGGRAP